MSTPYVPIIGGGFVQPATRSYIAITLQNAVNAGVVTLEWPFQYQNVQDVVAYYIYVTSDNNNNVLVLPDETLTSPGMSFVIVNVSNANTFAINDFGGGNIIPTGTMTVGKSINFVLTNNTTNVPGNWSTFPFGQGIAAVTSVGIASSTTGITVTGSPITGASVITLGIGANLAALNAINANGYVAYTGGNNFVTTQIQGTANQINVTNPTGNANNIISISNTLQVNQLSTPGISISVLANNTISTVVAAADLNLSPLGALNLNPATTINANANIILGTNDSLIFTGTNPPAHKLTLSVNNPAANVTYILPDTLPGAGQALGVSNGASPYTMAWLSVQSFVGPSTTHAIARYANTTGELENSLPTITDAGDIQDVTSISTTNFNIDAVANTISTALNNNMLITPTGTGLLYLNGYSYPKQGVATLNSWNVLGVGNDGVTITPFGYSNKNLLVNGNFNIWSILSTLSAASLYNNDSYIADGWKVIYEGAAATPPVTINASYDNLGPRGGQAQNYNFSDSYLTATVTIANRKFGFVQMLQNQTSIDLVSTLFTVGTLAKMSNAVTNIKVAAIAWTGAADNLFGQIANLVASWNLGGINPTLGANFSYIGQPASISSTTWAYNFVKGLQTVSTNVNVGIFIWEDSRAANVADTFSITGSKIEYGNSLTPIPVTTYADDLWDCNQYIDTSYLNGTVPGTAGVFAGARIVPYPIATNITNGFFYDKIEFKRPLYRTPTSINLYSVINGTANVLSRLVSNNDTAGAGSATVSVAMYAAASERCFSVFNNAALFAADSANGYHYIGNGTFF